MMMPLRNQYARSSGIVIFCLWLLALSSCSIEKHMDEKTNELVEKLEKIPQWENLQEEVITWDEAVRVSLSKNLELRRAQLAIDNADRSVKRIFLDMIPGVNLDMMITKDLEGLQDLSSSDVEYRTNILFNFPSLTRVPIDYYTAKASVYRAKKTLELKQREIVSKLYRGAREYVAAYDAYKLQKESVLYNDETEIRKIETDWLDKRKQLSSQIALVMGDVSKVWIIDPRTIPVVNWNRYKTASKKLDILVLTMLAMEIEASRLNMLGIKMQYFPELNINFYSPSLFSSTAGTYSGIYASSGDVRVNMALSWRLDTQLRIWYQLKSAKESHQFLIEDVNMRMIDRREKIKSLIKSREEFESWKNYMRKRSAFLLSRAPVSVEDYKKTRTETFDMIKEVQTQEAKNTEVEAALILEYGFL